MEAEAPLPRIHVRLSYHVLLFKAKSEVQDFLLHRISFKLYP